MVTISDILFRVYRNPLLQNVRKVDVVDHVKAVLKLLNISATFEEKSMVLTVIDFRVKLPKELHMLKSVTAINSNGVPGIRLKTSSDDRVLQQHSLPDNKPTTVTYKHVPGWLYTDFEMGDVEIIYTAFQVDGSGFPMIPDNESLLLAIENYIKVQYFTILVETGHMSAAILDRADQQYAWYIGQASNYFDTPNANETESIFDAIVRLVPDRDAYFTNFKYDSNTEKLVNHD